MYFCEFMASGYRTLQCENNRKNNKNKYISYLFFFFLPSILSIHTKYIHNKQNIIHMVTECHQCKTYLKDTSARLKCQAWPSTNLKRHSTSLYTQHILKQDSEPNIMWPLPCSSQTLPKPPRDHRRRWILSCPAHSQPTLQYCTTKPRKETEPEYYWKINVIGAVL